jgi:hypothetical protein
MVGLPKSQGSPILGNHAPNPSPNEDKPAVEITLAMIDAAIDALGDSGIY